MIPDFDIYRAANLFIMKYGRHASNHVDRWADAMLEAGMPDAYAVWKRISRVIEELQRTAPKPGEAVH